MTGASPHNYALLIGLDTAITDCRSQNPSYHDPFRYRRLELQIFYKPLFPIFGMSVPQKVGVNYYYPCSKTLRDRVGSITIEVDALIMHLIDLIRQSLGTNIDLKIFKISCLWEDIKPGSPEEPNSLGLPALLKLLNGDHEPLSMKSFGRKMTLDIWI